MSQVNHILPVARTFTQKEHVDWQVSAVTGISHDYANELGAFVLHMMPVGIQAREDNGKSIDVAEVHEGLMSYLLKVRELPAYAEYIRKQVAEHETYEQRADKFTVDHFICAENIEAVRRLEEAANHIRLGAQPQGGAVEANLTEVITWSAKAFEIIYGRPHGFEEGDAEYFVSLFCKYGIEVI